VAGTGNAAVGVGFENKERYGQLKLTTEKFYRITGNSTQLKGVEPDIQLPSPFDPDEMGESSQPTALPYDQVDQSEYIKQGNITDKLINKLNFRFQSRLKTDPNLKDLVEELEEYKILKEKNEYSLNYEIRKKEKEDSEKNRKAVKKISKSNGSSDDDDVYLTESEKILCDLISNTK
jgi:carboxyl-terminal processing protease